jgi:hypothetical protein
LEIFLMRRSDSATPDRGQFCFSVLALRPAYRQLTRQLAQDLVTYAPGIPLVVGTDRPADFQDCDNVQAFELKSQGVLHCFHDKRFVLAQARSRYGLAIQIDADTRICGSIPALPCPIAGLIAVHHENLLEHTERYNPERLTHLRKLADKLAIDIATAPYVGEAIFAVGGDDTQAKTFIQTWDRLAQYLELHGIHAGEGCAIGLAAAKAGLAITAAPWLEQINRDRQHLDHFAQNSASSTFQKLQRQGLYHLRLNQLRLRSLSQAKFFYG